MVIDCPATSAHKQPPTSLNRLARNPPTRRLRQHRHHERDILGRRKPMLHGRQRLLRFHRLARDPIHDNPINHIRHRVPGRDHIHRMPLGPQLVRPRARQPFHRRLSRAVDATGGYPDAAEQRADADDAAAAGGGQVREHGLRGEDEAAHVGVEGAGEDVGRRVAQCSDDLGARVVDQDVDGGAEGGGGGGDDFGGRAEVARVGLDFDGAGGGGGGGGGAGGGEVRDDRDDVVGELFAAGGDVGDGDLVGVELGSVVCGGRVVDLAVGLLTFAPRLASSMAMPAPMPREPPVTMATLPASVKGLFCEETVIFRYFFVETWSKGVNG